MRFLVMSYYFLNKDKKNIRRRILRRGLVWNPRFPLPGRTPATKRRLNSTSDYTQPAKYIRIRLFPLFPEPLYNPPLFSLPYEHPASNTLYPESSWTSRCPLPGHTPARKRQLEEEDDTQPRKYLRIRMFPLFPFTQYHPPLISLPT